MYQAIVFLPLLGCLIAGFFGRIIGARPSELVTTLFLFVSAILSWIAFVRVGFGHVDERIVLMTWMQSGDLKVDWALRIDTLTAVMLVVVTTVSALVHLYSIGYMEEDPHRPRFFAYLVALYLRDAGARHRRQSGADVLRLGGRGARELSPDRVLVSQAGSQRRRDQGLHRQPRRRFRLRARHFRPLHDDEVDRSRHRVRAGAGAGRQDHQFLRLAGRRADADLPAAVHGRDGQVGAIPAAHLAAGRDGRPDAGLRADPCRHHGDRRRVHGGAALAAVRTGAESRSTVVTFIGATTAFFAATVGLVQNDIKRIVAYSTCSQLGYMFVAMGVGAYSVGMWHLFTHAFFKALLVPWLRLGHPRDAPRAGHPPHGRAAQENPLHLLDDGDRHAGADRLSRSPPAISPRTRSSRPPMPAAIRWRSMRSS